MKKYSEAESPKTAQCYDCGLAYTDPGWIELVIPNVWWELINPSQHTGGGLLCANCMAHRLGEIGAINVPGYLAAGVFVGASESHIRLINSVDGSSPYQPESRFLFESAPPATTWQRIGSPIVVFECTEKLESVAVHLDELIAVGVDSGGEYGTVYVAGHSWRTDKKVCVELQKQWQAWYAPPPDHLFMGAGLDNPYLDPEYRARMEQDIAAAHRRNGRWDSPQAKVELNQL